MPGLDPGILLQRIPHHNSHMPGLDPGILLQRNPHLNSPMPGLDPGILFTASKKIAGSSPAMMSAESGARQNAGRRHRSRGETGTIAPTHPCPGLTRASSSRRNPHHNSHMPGPDPGILFTAQSTPQLIMPGLDPGILFTAPKKDRRIKSGDDER
jgi:hypothetical protein